MPKPATAKLGQFHITMRQGVEDELDRLVAEGTLEPIEYSD